jgi:hypothetical protein
MSMLRLWWTTSVARDLWDLLTPVGRLLFFVPSVVFAYAVIATGVVLMEASRLRVFGYIGRAVCRRTPEHHVTRL